MTTQEKAIWELVHNWCDKQYAEIPDYNRRVLMDKILHLQERYRAQLELPSDEETQEICENNGYWVDSPLGNAWINGAKWMRDHIAKQLKQGI